MNSTNQKKIVYILPGIDISGGVAVVLQHANRLIKRGYDVSLLYIGKEKTIDWFVCNVPLVWWDIANDTNCPIDHIDIAIATQFSTVKLLDRCPDAKRKIYFVQSDERRFGLDRSQTIECHNSYLSDIEYMTEAMWIQRWLKQEFDHNAYYVPNGLDTDLFFETKPLEEKTDKMRVLIEGPINVPFKGMKDSYEAVRDLDCELWIVSSGGNPPEDWKYDHFFENVSMSKMREIYSSCDIFLKMSRIEGFFGPPLEAMACGCAVVVGKCTGYDEYIVDGENGLVVDQRDVTGARNALQRIMNNEELKKKLISHGHATAKSWSWDRSIDHLEKMIREEEIEQFYDEKTLERYDYTPTVDVMTLNYRQRALVEGRNMKEIWYNKNMMKEVMKKNQKIRIFIYSVMLDSGCYYYRGDVFLRYCREFDVSTNVDFVKREYQSTNYIAEKIYQADVIIFLRPKDINFLSLVYIFQSAGKIVLIDNDDDFSTIEKENPAHAIKEYGSVTNNLFIKAADGVIGSTKSLTDKMKQLNDTVVTIPNLIDVDEFVACRQEFHGHEDKKIHIGITGSTATLENTAGFIAILDTLKKKHDNIEYVFFSDKGSLELLKKHFADAVFVPTVAFQEYAQKLASLHLDIALIPRADNDFNRFKSNCKYLEYVALNIPVIAQGFDGEASPYEKDIEDGVTGYIARNKNDWVTYVEKLLDQEHRRMISKNAFAFVAEKYDIKKLVSQWDEGIDVLLSRCDLVSRSSVITISKKYYIKALKKITKTPMIEKQSQRINEMQSSKFWKMRNQYMELKERVKNIIDRDSNR